MRDVRPTLYLGVDGEGQGRFPHRYTLLAAASKDLGYKRCVEDPGGLSSRACLDFLLSLPQKDCMVSAFAFNYDLTKILQDVPDGVLYELFRPELRARDGEWAKLGPRPVPWDPQPWDPWGGGSSHPDDVYWFNLVGSKFTVKKGKLKRIVWDTFKFYGTKFVAACKSWKVGTVEQLTLMQEMKDQRHKFDELSHDDVRDYCYEECSFMASLTEKLVAAHEDAQIPLTTFYGAGSSAGGILKVLGAKEKRRDPPEPMKHAVACAFSGGRFENSRVGPVRRPVTNWDISSAYPYGITSLPCLEHGQWSVTRSAKKMREARAALVHYKLGPAPSKYVAWGPFPYRMNEGKEKGSICYPIESAGGWVWRDEFLAGERVFSHVQFREAWIYECDCDCRPFEMIPKWYLERLAIGKEGPGLVIKLGLNSLYGKMAQSVGNAQFQCWIWAGIITSGCRAQALDVLGMHEDHADLLMIATDGIKTSYSRLQCDKSGRSVDLPMPRPKDTGTDIDVTERSTGKVTRKPLGGWEGKLESRGVFLARPGVYFPLSPTKDDLEEVKARGLGRKFLFDNWHVIVAAYEEGGVNGKAVVENLERFCGAKTSVSLGVAGSTSFRRAAGGKMQHKDGSWHDAPAYGEWVKRRVEVNFHPKPKRDGLGDDGVSLRLRRFPRDGAESAPYSRLNLSAEALELLQAELEALEQPDIDLSEVYGNEGGI